MKVRAERCRCRPFEQDPEKQYCSKWIVTPLFYSAEASLPKEEADELVRRWNAFEPDGEPE